MLAVLAFLIQVTAQESLAEEHKLTTTLVLRSQPWVWVGAKVRVCGTVQYGAKEDWAIIWNERVDIGSEQADPNKSVSAVYAQIRPDVRRRMGNVCVTGLFERTDGLTVKEADEQGKFVHTPAEISLDKAYHIVADSMTAVD